MCSRSRRKTHTQMMAAQHMRSLRCLRIVESTISLLSFSPYIFSYNRTTHAIKFILFFGQNYAPFFYFHTPNFDVSPQHPGLNLHTDWKKNTFAAWDRSLDVAPGLYSPPNRRGPISVTTLCVIRRAGGDRDVCSGASEPGQTVVGRSGGNIRVVWDAGLEGGQHRKLRRRRDRREHLRFQGDIRKGESRRAFESVGRGGERGRPHQAPGGSSCP